MLQSLLLIAAGLFAYHNSFAGQFHFDDFSCIPDNPYLRTLWPLWEAMKAVPETALAGRPAVSLSFGINYALGGLEVFGYHAVNLGLHLSTALLLFGIIRRTLLTAPLRARYVAQATWLAFTVTLLWMVHPLLTESVTYMIQRTELLMGLAFLMTLYSVIRSANSSHPRRWHVAAVLSCVVGMGSKEVMVVAPVLILLYDRTFLAGTVRQAIRQRRALYLGLALSWVVLAMLVVSGARTTTAGFGVAHLTPWAYALTQSRVILHYLRLAVWPHPLVLDYSDWPIATSLAEVAGPAVAVTLLVMATLWLLRKQPAVGFIGAWMFLILAPTSSVMPIVTEIAAERRMYLPLITVVVFLVLTTWELLGGVIRPRTMRTRVAACAVVGLLAILSGLTLRRNVQYQSEMGMLHDVIAKRPRNARAHYNLGVALAEQRQEEAAIANFTEALRLSPDYAEAHGNLGVVLAERGHWEEAIAHYTRALRLRPDLAEAHNNMSVALARQGRVDEALFHSLEALRLRPDSTAAYNNWRRVMAQRARRSE